MAFDEELDVRKPKPALKPLDDMSVDELQALIGEHESEIARIRAAIAKKEAHRAAAASFFKLPG
ncbi:DUF1192 domain-containing protein [Roseiterribacter gracilis]|uniref:DUF1192 domain-containing protein n=1 Tax=Roseiterribacter gracilis TaxID=2812848 RepID=A0A8S8XC83_9PROT|nr:hypothetical protein TMPK1_25310 [Rhodospirillales bacterium TMPK1]